MSALAMCISVNILSTLLAFLKADVEPTNSFSKLDKFGNFCLVAFAETAPVL